MRYDDIYSPHTDRNNSGAQDPFSEDDDDDLPTFNQMTPRVRITDTNTRQVNTGRAANTFTTPRVRISDTTPGAPSTGNTSAGKQAKSAQPPKRSHTDVQSGNASTSRRRRLEQDTDQQLNTTSSTHRRHINDPNDGEEAEPDYVADDNSDDKYAVLQRAARVFLFINPVPTSEEIATFVHSIYDYYDEAIDELVVYNIESDGWHQAFTHTRNQKSTYKSRALKAMGVHFTQALQVQPDLPTMPDKDLRQFWSNHYSANAFLLCWPHLYGYVNPDQSKPLAQYVMKCKSWHRIMLMQRG